MEAINICYVLLSICKPIAIIILGTSCDLEVAIKMFIVVLFLFKQH